MYIPTHFFGQINTCISASGGDEIGEFVSGSTVWKYHKFTTLGSSSFTIHSGSSNDFRVFLVGGGGGGGKTQPGGGGSPQGAGGGGGGGIVYTDFRFGPGTHSIYVGDGGTWNTSGENTWIQVDYEPSNYQGYFPTSSQLTAEGGGYGGYLDTVFPYINGAGNGGSGGGQARGLVSGQGYFSTSIGQGRNPQGLNGGKIYIPSGGSTSWEGGAGGGGAASSGSDANFSTSQNTAARGGHGKLFNIDGTDIYYGAGGGGRGEVGWPSSVANGSNSYGAGGSGSNDNANPGILNGHDLREGRQGIAVVMYPVCQLELLDCTTYSINGGALGGTVSYVPCGGTGVITSDVEFDQLATICTRAVDGYPSSTGTVTVTPSQFTPTVTDGSVINVTDINTGSFYNTQFVGPTSLQNIQNTGVTLEIWAKNPVLTQNYDAFIGLWDGQSIPNRDWIEIRQDAAPATLNHVLGDIYSNESPTFEDKTSPSSAVANSNNWYHHILTFDVNTNVAKYYRNGSLEGSVSSSLDPIASYQTVHVGQQEDGPICNMFVGEYRVYTSSLSSVDILNNFDGTKQKYGYSGSFTGKCNTEIPITPVPTCDTGSGEQQYETYIYNWEVRRQCYPTPSSCQTIVSVGGTLYYTDREGNEITQSITGFPSTTFTGQICAREFPSPNLVCNSSANQFGTCSLEKTDLVCGYYCSGSI